MFFCFVEAFLDVGGDGEVFSTSVDVFDKLSSAVRLLEKMRAAFCERLMKHKHHSICPVRCFLMCSWLWPPLFRSNCC